MDRTSLWALVLGALSALSLFLAAVFSRRREKAPIVVTVTMDKPIQVNVVAEVRGRPPLEGIPFAPPIRELNPDRQTARSEIEGNPAKTVHSHKGDDFERVLEEERAKIRSRPPPR